MMSKGLSDKTIKIGLPASKSELIRMILLSILLEDTFEINNINYCDDVKYALNILAKFKIIETTGSKIIVKESKLSDTKIFNCGESALIARMLPPILSLKMDTFVLEANESLKNRNIKFSYKLFENFGIKTNNSNFPFEFKSSFLANRAKIIKDITSQNITGLLFSLPFLYGDSTLEFENLVSSSYINLSMIMLKYLGIQIEVKNNNFLIRGKQKIKATKINISTDSSSAAFWYALQNFDPKINYEYNNEYKIDLDLEYLKKIYRNQEFLVDSFSLTDHPDLFPLVTVLAAKSKQSIKVKCINRLQYKESDRIKTSLNILNSIDCNYITDVNKDYIIINNVINPPKEIVVNSKNDHRIVMSGILFSFIFKIKVKIIEMESVSKSYPKIFEHLELIGVKKNEFDW